MARPFFGPSHAVPLTGPDGHPVPPEGGKKGSGSVNLNRNQVMLAGAVGVAVLAFLARSQNASTASTSSATPSTYDTTDQDVQDLEAQLAGFSPGDITVVPAGSTVTSSTTGSTKPKAPTPTKVPPKTPTRGKKPAAPKPKTPAKKSTKPASSKPAYTTYTVKKGDTLSALAQKYLGNANDYSQIARANGISNPNLIKVGQQLKIPK